MPTPTHTQKDLDQLIREDWPKLKRFFRTKVPDAAVLDLVQATMLAFVAGQAQAQNPRAYLWGIARKQVLKHYGRFKPTEEFDSRVHTAMDLGPSLSSTIANRTTLQRALHTLPVDHQMAFELRHGEGLKLEEVAEAMDISLATAKRYLAAAKEELSKQLRGELGELGEEYKRL